MKGMGDRTMFKTNGFPTFILAIMSLLFFTRQGYTEQLFFDDFEEETIGAEPSKWTPAEGAHVAKVIEDPTDSDNKVFEATNRLNGSDAGRHYVIGDESWTDYLVEWDWMIFADGYMGVAFRYQDRDNYYLVDRRLGGIQIQFYSRKNAAWALMDSADYPNEIGVWYRCRFEIIEDHFIFKIKERDDDTHFSEIEPLLETSDADFGSGGVANAGIAYIDNVVVGETEDDLSSMLVQVKDKLAVTWGRIKTNKQ